MKKPFHSNYAGSTIQRIVLAPENLECMNAVMRELEIDAVMTESDQENLTIQVAELRSDVRHVQSDVTDIKADLRITNQRIESLRKETGERFDKHEREINARFDKQEREINARLTTSRFDKVDARFDKVDARFDKVDQKFEAVHKEIGDVKDSLSSAKVWALGLYIALAGSLFYTLAHGFKWL